LAGDVNKTDSQPTQNQKKFLQGLLKLLSRDLINIYSTFPIRFQGKFEKSSELQFFVESMGHAAKFVALTACSDRIRIYGRPRL